MIYSTAVTILLLQHINLFAELYKFLFVNRGILYLINELNYNSNFHNINTFVNKSLNNYHKAIINVIHESKIKLFGKTIR